MKTIVAITKTELRTLFYSPIAWTLMIIFTIHGGFTVARMLENILRPSGMMQGNYIQFLFNSSGTPNGLFSAIKDNLYLYIPLLTMGLFSREYNSGSIKLLQSSPVKVYEMVLGKYLAILAYWFILLLMTWLIIFRCVRSIEGADWGPVLSGMSGLYLLAAAYSAIGVFMSAITSYQVVAALGTLISLAVLNFIGGLWQDMPVLRDISWFLNFERHINPMLRGLIVSSDLLYFMIIICLFIGATILWLQDGRSSRGWAWRAARYTAMVAGLLVPGYVFSRPSLLVYFDATKEKANTLTPAGQAILKKIGGPVKVTAYVNLLDADVAIGMPSTRNYDRDFWSPYTRFLPGLILNYVNYYDTVENDYIFKNKVYRGMSLTQIAEKVADGRDWDIKDHLPPDSIHKVIDLSPEENLMVRQVVYKGRRSFIRRFDDLFHVPHEREIITAFAKVADGPATIGLVSGHYERDLRKKGDRDYRNFFYRLSDRNCLINKGFDMVTVALDRPIPDSLSALVIAGPTRPYSAGEINRLREYVSTGGNLLICASAGDQEILSALTGFLGINFLAGTLMEDHKDIEQDYVFPGFTPAVKNYAGTFDGFFQSPDKILMGKACGIIYSPSGHIPANGFRVDTLLMVKAVETWNKTGPFKTDTGRLIYAPEKGDTRTSLPVALALTREKGNKEQRILVLGSADMLSNGAIDKNFPELPTANRGFAENIFKWFCYGRYPLQLPDTPDPPSRLLMDNTSLGWFRLVFVWAIPMFLLVCGGALLFVRKIK